MKPSAMKGETETLARLQASWRLAAFGLGASAFILFGLREAIVFIVDDSFITFRFARNWGEWGAPVFNSFELQEGRTPVEGYSNLLWMALLGFYDSVLQLDIVRASTGTQLGLGIATLAMCTWGARSVLALGTIGTLAAPLLLATMSPFVAWTSGGMETTLFAFCLCSLFVLGLDQLKSESGNARIVGFALAAVFTVLVRVEGLAWALGTLGVLWLGSLWSGVDRKRRKHLLFAAGLAVAAFVIQAGWRRWLYGTWVPNTVTAKTGSETGAVLMRGAKYLGSWAVITVTPIVFFAFAALTLRRLSGLTRAASLASLGLALGFIAYNLFVGGDWMPFFRFLAPVAPVMAIGLAISLDQWKPRASAGWIVGLMIMQPLALFDVHPAPQSLRESLRFRTFAAGYTTERGRIEAARRNLVRFSMVGHALHQGLVPGTVLAHDAIGSTAWFAPKLDFKDRNGLVTPEVSSLSPNGPGQGTAGHDKRVPRAWFLDHGDPKAQFFFASVIQQSVDVTNPQVIAAIARSLTQDPSLAAPQEQRLFEETVIRAVPIASGPASGKTLILLERANPAKAKAFWSR